MPVYEVEDESLEVDSRGWKARREVENSRCVGWMEKERIEGIGSCLNSCDR